MFKFEVSHCTGPLPSLATSPADYRLRCNRNRRNADNHALATREAEENKSPFSCIVRHDPRCFIPRLFFRDRYTADVAQERESSIHLSIGKKTLKKREGTFIRDRKRACILPSCSGTIWGSERPGNRTKRGQLLFPLDILARSGDFGLWTETDHERHIRYNSTRAQKR